MATFRYTARNPEGQEVSGTLEASDRQEATLLVRESYPALLTLKAVPKKIDLSRLKENISFRRPDGEAFTLMCGHLAMLLSSGVSEGTALRVAAEESEDRGVRTLLQKTADAAESGKRLDEAFREVWGELLPPLFSEVLTRGAEEGRLPEALEELKNYYDLELTLDAKVRGETGYPFFVLFAGIALLLVLLLTLIPVFAEVFESFLTELPLFMRILLAVSLFLRKALPWILLIIGLAAAFLFVFWLIPFGNHKLTALRRKLPFTRKKLLLRTAVRFSGAMALLTESGIPLPEALRLSAPLMPDPESEEKIDSMAEMVEEGTPVSEAARSLGIFPEVLPSMMEGQAFPERLYRNVTEHCEERLLMLSERTGRRLRPVILLVLAALAAFLAAGIFSGIFAAIAA